MDGAVVWLDEAMRQHDRLAMPFELGRTLLARGRVLRRARQKRGARDAIEQALAIFDELGTVLWSEQARVEYARIGLRRTSPGELTEIEERVAELAASGLTNRLIASRVFLTPKSVEDVLARVYRKLEIRSRAELGARIAARHRAG